MTVSAKVTEQPQKNTQPTLYYYEHCPYCVRVLTFAGLAGITLTPVVLLNDDEATPIRMIGQKMLPILAISANHFMGESLDIIAYLSERYNYSLNHDATLEAQIEDWLYANRTSNYSLTIPRWVKQPFAEFATESAIAYFTKKKTVTVGDFEQALADTPRWQQAMTEGLQQGDALFSQLNKQVAEKADSYAAITLFSALYGLRFVEGLQWTPNARQFMTVMAERSGLEMLPSS